MEYHLQDSRKVAGGYLEEARDAATLIAVEKGTIKAIKT